MQKPYLAGFILRLGLIFSLTIALLFSCNNSDTRKVTSIEGEKNDLMRIQLTHTIKDTTFADRSNFKWGILNGKVKFRWTKSETYIDRTIESEYQINLSEMSQFKFIGSFWTRGGNYKPFEIYTNGKIMLFGYTYLPHGISFFYVKWEDIVEFGQKFIDMKWYFPLINEKTGMIFRIGEDFNRYLDPADSIISFTAYKSSLSNFPEFGNDTLQFYNYQIDYCEFENENLDSCAWSNLIMKYPRFKKFFESK